MNFPILNVSSNLWTEEEDPTLFILYSPFICTADNNLFSTYFLNQKYVDAKGEIFLITGRKIPNSFLRRLFKFIPNIYKIELVFEKTGEYMMFDAAKKYLFNKISFFTPNEDLHNWMEKVKLSKSFEEMLT